MIDRRIDWKHELFWTVVFMLAVVPVFMGREIAEFVVKLLSSAGM